MALTGANGQGKSGGGARVPTFFRPLLEAPGVSILGGTAEGLLNWGSGSSFWIFPMATSCCGIELMATAASRVDCDRMGTIIRGTPRQCDVMVVAGTITVKMAPRVKKLWEQMPEPKWCVAMGSCAISGDFYRDIYSVVQGIDTVVPVDVYVPGCPPNPEGLVDGLMRLKEKILASRTGKAEAPRAPDPVGTPRPNILCVGDADRDPAIDAAQEAEASRPDVEAEAFDVPVPEMPTVTVAAPEDFEKLLKELGAVDAPDSPPLVDKARHLELGQRAYALGFRQFAYVVASHWPAKADAPESYEVAYGLRAVGPGSRLAQWRVRTPVTESIASLTPLFAGANWGEREQYDLVGVRFAGHPDLRRIMLPESWQGHPLRRDYPIETRIAPWR